MKKIILICCATLASQSFAMEKKDVTTQQNYKIAQKFTLWTELVPELKSKILDLYTQTVAIDAKNCREFKQPLLILRQCNEQINNLLESLYTHKYIITLADKFNKRNIPSSFYTFAQIILSKSRFQEFKKIYQEQANKLSNEIRSILWTSSLENIVKVENDIKLLIAKGANLNLQNKNGDTLLIDATITGVPSIVKFLIDAQVDLDIQNNYGVTALIVLSNQIFGEDLVKMIIDAGANLNLQNKQDDTALILAVRNGFTSMVKFLINAKANLNLQDTFGNTALIWASESYNKEFVKYLIEAGANAEIKNHGKVNAYIYALKFCDLEMLTLLKPSSM